MARTIYKVKHLFWYMVLATVGVMISASNSPQTKVKMIVASQHAPTNAQEKRQLRPSSSIMEETNGGDEERMTPFEKTFEALTSGAKADMDLDLKLALPSGHTLETLTSGAKADKNANNLPKSAALTTGDVVNKNFKKSLALSSGFTDEKLTAGAKVDKNANILLKSAALTTGDGVGKNKEILDEGANIIANVIEKVVMKDVAEKIEESLELKWSDAMIVRLEKLLLAGKKDVTQILMEVKEWNQESGVGFPIPLLFDKLSKYFTERELAEQLLLAQDKESVKESVKKMANMLADYQMMKWKYKDNYNGKGVFHLLGVQTAGMDTPLFDTFVSYVVMLDVKIFSEDITVLQNLQRLRATFSDEKLYERLSAFKFGLKGMPNSLVGRLTSCESMKAKNGSKKINYQCWESANETTVKHPCRQRANESTMISRRDYKPVLDEADNKLISTNVRRSTNWTTSFSKCGRFQVTG